jgi:hypothetical protein
MHPHDLIAPHGDEAKELIAVQIGFGGEWQVRYIGDAFDIAGLEANSVKRGAVMCGLAINARQDIAQPCQLQRLDLIE